MGGKDKFLLEHNGVTLLQNTINQAQAQVSELILNLNGNPERVQGINIPIVADSVGHYDGPLAGILSAMSWACKNRRATQWIVSFPCDSVQCPDNWVNLCLQYARSKSLPVAFINTPNGPFYTYSVWSLGLKARLQTRFQSGARSLKSVFSTYPDSGYDIAETSSFSNINTPDDWERLRHNLKDL